jgi:hypothetical protein
LGNEEPMMTHRGKLLWQAADSLVAAKNVVGEEPGQVMAIEHEQREKAYRILEAVLGSVPEPKGKRQ